MSLVQESINVQGKCAVQISVPVVENHSDGYPENMFGIWNNQHSIFERMLRLDDHDIQWNFRNLKPRIEAALD